MTTADSHALDRPGRAPAVLLVHGFTGTPWEIRPVADALSARGFACMAPLLPGHGQTPEALSRTGWTDWSVAVDSALRALVARHGRAVVLGHSMGALLALDAAARHQDAGVVAVVTLACALRLSTAAERVLALAERLGDALPDVYWPKGRGDAHDPAVRVNNPSYRRQPLRAARQLLRGQRLARSALPALRVPVLAVHGLLDRTAPLASSVELLERVGSRDAALVLVPRSGHPVGADSDREEVARQVCAFVERIAADRR